MMKRIIYMVLIMLLLLSITACGSKEPNHEVTDFPPSIGELKNRLEEYFDVVYGEGEYSLKVDTYPSGEDMSIWIEPKGGSLCAFIRPMIASSNEGLPCARLSVVYSVDGVVKIERYGQAILWACGVGESPNDRAKLIDQAVKIIQNDSEDILNEVLGDLQVIFRRYEDPESTSTLNQYELIVQPIS